MTNALTMTATVNDIFNYEEPEVDPDVELFERRKQVIQRTWRSIQIGLDVDAAEVFYDKLFKEYPMVRPMFQDDMTSQYKKLYSAVSLAVKFLDDVDTLLPVLKDLGERHAAYGVVRLHYDAVTECFLWTLNTYIFTTMTREYAMRYAFEVADAWEWALTFIGTTMADAADEAVEKVRIAKLERRLLKLEGRIEKLNKVIEEDPKTTMTTTTTTSTSDELKQGEEKA